MKTSESITKIAVALLKAQSSMGNATKGAANPYFKSSYADLNSIREVVTPALNTNGITLLQPTTVIDGKSFVETILLHESGEYLSGLTEIVVSKVNDPQAAGSAISYARRYGLQSFLSVGAVDDDAEKAMSRGPSPAQIKYESKKQEVKAEVLSAPNSSAANSTIEVKSTPVAEPVKAAPVKKAMFQKPGAKVETPTPAVPTNVSKASSSDDADAWN